MTRDAVLTAERAAVRAVQERNFAATLDLVFAGHRHYREVVGLHGLTRADFATLDDLHKLPVTTKAAYIAGHADFVLDAPSLPIEMRMVWETLYTTGSSGKPTPFVSTSFDFYNILTSYRRMLTMRGVGPGDVLGNLYPLTQYPQGAYIRVMNAASALHIPVVAALPGRPSPHFHEGASNDEVVDLLRRHRVTAVWGVPSYVRLILRRAAERGVALPDIRVLLLSGEELSAPMRQNILSCARDVQAAGAVIRASYGATELQAGFVECEAQMGYHNPAPEEFWVEIVDPVSFGPVPDGREGLVLITHLNRRGTVLLRYALGDLAVRSREPCPHCGATVDRIVQGPRRADALVKVKGMLVDPAALCQTIEAIAEIDDFQFRIRKSDASDPFSMDDLLLLAAPAPGADPDGLAASLRERVKAAVGVTPTVDLVPSSHFVDPGARWKAKRVVDDRQPGS